MILDILKVSKIAPKPYAYGSLNTHFIFLDKEFEFEVDTTNLHTQRIGIYLVRMGVTDADIIGTYTIRSPLAVMEEERFSVRAASAPTSFKALRDADPKQVIMYTTQNSTVFEITNKPAEGLIEYLSKSDQGLMSSAYCSVFSATCGLKGSDAEVMLLSDEFKKDQAYRISDVEIKFNF